jgi:hypothetical protein
MKILRYYKIDRCNKNPDDVLLFSALNASKPTIPKSMIKTKCVTTHNPEITGMIRQKVLPEAEYRGILFIYA